MKCNRFWVLGILMLWSVPAVATVIGGVEYEKVDPGPPFCEAPRPVQDWQPPDPTPAEQAAGVVLYRPDDPMELRPYRIPKPGEHIKELSISLARNEITCTWLGAWAIADLRGIDLRVDLGEAPVDVEVRRIHFWPQRVNSRAQEYAIIPELLLPLGEGVTKWPASGGVLEDRPFSVSAKETFAFWFTVKPLPDALPGRYTGNLLLRSADRKALSIPLHIQIYPFDLLKPPDKTWGMHVYHTPYENCLSRISDEKLIAFFRDFVEHGMEALWGMPNPNIYVRETKDGKVEAWLKPEEHPGFARVLRASRQAGMTGPWILGLNQCSYYKGEFSEEHAEAGRRAIAQALSETLSPMLGHPPYVYGPDEPKPQNTEKLDYIERWGKAGIRFLITSTTAPVIKRLGQYIDYAAVSGPGGGPQSNFDTRQLLASYGITRFYYGSGCYDQNPMVESRSLTGFQFYKSDAPVQMSWTFFDSAYRGDMFNDFDGSERAPREPKDKYTAYPWLRKANDWSTFVETIPTIAWESIREGVNDAKYAYTLEQLCRQGLTCSQRSVRQQAWQAKQKLQAIPWRGLGVAEMDALRHNFAEEIVNLQAALRGELTRRPAPAKLTFHLTAKPTKPTTTDVSVVVIPCVQQRPRIDGKLDEQCWEDAGQVTWEAGSTTDRTQTIVRIMSGPEQLYVAYECPEPYMQRLRSSVKQPNNSKIWLDDSVELFIAPQNERDSYAHFIINTAGIVYKRRGMSQPFIGTVQAKVDRSRRGYSVEIAIPWADLAVLGELPGQVIALNFCRNRYTVGDGLNTSWSPTGGTYHRPDRFGTGVLADSPVLLEKLSAQSWWGKQSVTAQLANTSHEPQKVNIFLNGEIQTHLEIPAGGSQQVQVDADVSEHGEHILEFGWGGEGKPVAVVPIQIFIPQPLDHTALSFIEEPGGKVEILARIGLPPAQAARSHVRWKIRPLGKGPVYLCMPADHASQRVASIEVPAQVVELRVSIIRDSGKVLATSNGTILVASG